MNDKDLSSKGQINYENTKIKSTAHSSEPMNGI